MGLPARSGLQRADENPWKNRKKELTDKGLPEQLSTDTVLLPFLRDVMAILHIKESLHTQFESVGHLYIQVDDFLGCLG